MEDRKPKWYMVIFSNCSDSTKEDEFNRWYDEVHVPDIMSEGLFVQATRLVNTNYPQPTEHKYLTIYETEKEPEQVWEQLQQPTARWQKNMNPNVSDVKAMFFAEMTFTSHKA
ncbi:DUF4286 family protein [Chloroflexota bacterium]